jgi:tetratricopeptide (TPR) repeat protein
VLDVARIPRAQEKIIKTDLVAARLVRTIQKKSVAFLQKLGPIYSGWMKVQRGFRTMANHIADRYRSLEWKQKWMVWRGRSRQERRAHLLALLDEADELRRAEKHAEAEKKYVEIITLDPRNVSAYVGLGKTYFRAEQWREAEETLRHVVETLDGAHERAWAFLGRTLKMAEKWEQAAAAFEHAVALDDTLGKRWVDLGECYEAMGAVDKAVSAFQKAAQIEPHNPRTLDHLIEIGIISGNKRLAKEAFSELQAVNPENQKLGEWMERIGEM